MARIVFGTTTSQARRDPRGVNVVALAILGGSVLLTLLCRASGNFLSIFGLAAITAAAIYLLDVRPALRDATDGTGPW